MNETMDDKGEDTRLSTKRKKKQKGLAISRTKTTKIMLKTTQELSEQKKTTIWNHAKDNEEW